MLKKDIILQDCELDTPLLKGKHKKVTGLMKDELGGTEFGALRPNSSSYLTNEKDENEKPKGTIKCVVRRKLKFEDYKHCLKATRLETKINQLEKN